MIYGLIFFSNNLNESVFDTFSLNYLSSYMFSFSNVFINCINFIKLCKLSVYLITKQPLESPELKNLYNYKN